jgi:glucose/arabinose dehydrogenase
MQEGKGALFPLGARPRHRYLPVVITLRPPLRSRRAAAVLVLLTLAPGPGALAQSVPPPRTCSRTSGLVLPEGFCAVTVATHLGRIRHLVVLPNGDVLAARSGGAGGIVALRDTDGDGKADQRKDFGDEGGTGIGYHEGFLWFAANSRVVRWPWTVGDLLPRGTPDVVVEDLPTGGHAAKALAFLGGDTLIVNIGSETNSCQREDRSDRSPGRDPCTELEKRAGLWRFSTARRQRPADGTRFATGLRNSLALAVQPGTGRLFAAPHGRDQLGQNWGYTDAQNAELPAEEFLVVEPGDDVGWPYCYYDWQRRRKVLAPEYGGTGSEIGRCADKKDPLIGFPGHWAPMAIVFAEGDQFPSHYRGGAFVAFHGSWNRAPLPQQGYRVVFVPFGPDHLPVGAYETFAISARGETRLRPAGLAVGPDGSLYIGDEASGTIWRVMARP